MNNSKSALALVGMPGSGKSTCATHLQRRGFYQFRFGSIIVGEVARRGLQLTPANERLVREEFRANDGMAAIARRALPHLRLALETNDVIVLDGLYSFSEYKMLRTELNAQLILIAIVSDRTIRYGRLAHRVERPLSPAEAEERDIAEIENLEKGGPIAIADYTLVNNYSTSELLAMLDTIIDPLVVLR